MNEQMKKVLDTFMEELNVLLKAKTVEGALCGLVAYLNNGLNILYEVVSRFEDEK